LIKIQDIPQQLIKHRSLWHIGFWLAYAFTRVLPYYVTVMYYGRNLLEFMLFAEVGFIILVYSTLWLYRRFYAQKKYTLYFGIGLVAWSFYVFLIILFQQYYVKNLSPIGSPDWWSVYFTYLTKYYITFIVLTLMKYFKDNYIAQYVNKA
jgi:hypothetical protein